MSKDFTGSQIGAIDIPAATRHRAALYVATKAISKTDRTQLLAMLGLLPAHHPAMLRPQDHGLRGYQLGCRCKRCVKGNRNRLARQRAARKGANA
jgi:hypothetical protein